MSDYTKAKGFIKIINDLKLKGVEKFKYVGLKKDAMLERFMEAVEAVDDAGKLNKLPTDLVDFYESFVEDEEVEESDEAEEVEDDDEWEDVDDDEDEEEDDDDLEEEEDEDEDDLEEEDEDEDEDDDLEEEEDEDDDWDEDEEDEEEPEPKPKKKKKAKPAKKAKAKKAKPEPKPKKKKKAEKPEKPAKGKKGKKKEVVKEKKPRTIKATTRMSARINDGVLVLKYGDMKPKKIKVQNTDKGKLKKTIARVVKWAKEVGATPGQVQACKKAFTSKGYHVTKP